MTNQSQFEPSPFEQRISALIRTLANRAPGDVDPHAVTRLASAASSQRGPIAMRFLEVGSGLGYVLLALALVGVIVAGAIAGGSWLLQRDRDPALSSDSVVTPFVGLPPEGATPSIPEAGELILSLDARVRAVGLKFHRVWVYADGRMIWTQEGTTSGVIQQRLTPFGVERLRSEVVSAEIRVLEEPHADGEIWGQPGVLWGGIRVRIGDQLQNVAWADASLPARLADPMSWLPESAWTDKRLAGFVPSHYAVCFEHYWGGTATIERSRLATLLPRPARDLIQSRALDMPPQDPVDQDARCLYQVTTDDARALAGMFTDGGLRQDGDVLSYEFDMSELGADGEAVVQLLPVLPHGGLVCYCG